MNRLRKEILTSLTIFHLCLIGFLFVAYYGMFFSTCLLLIKEPSLPLLTNYFFTALIILFYTFVAPLRPYLNFGTIFFSLTGIVLHVAVARFILLNAYAGEFIMPISNALIGSNFILGSILFALIFGLLTFTGIKFSFKMLQTNENSISQGMRIAIYCRLIEIALGILCILINFGGGYIIGTKLLNFTPIEAIKTYPYLTIGSGLTFILPTTLLILCFYIVTESIRYQKSLLPTKILLIATVFSTFLAIVSPTYLVFVTIPGIFVTLTTLFFQNRKNKLV